MTEQYAAHIDPRVMHEVADEHEQVAAVVEAARTAGGDISAAISGLGPIMHEVKAAVADILVARDNALRGHVDSHRDTADKLRLEAARYSAVDENNAARLNQLDS